MTQLLLNRGYLSLTQVRGAAAYQVATDGPSLLQALVDLGAISDATVVQVLADYRQDRRCRDLAVRHGLLSPQELSVATRLQRGTRRTLLQTIMQERLCSRQEVAEQIMRLGATPEAAPVAVGAR